MILRLRLPLLSIILALAAGQKQKCSHECASLTHAGEPMKEGCRDGLPHRFCPSGGSLYIDRTPYIRAICEKDHVWRLYSNETSYISVPGILEASCTPSCADPPYLTPADIAPFRGVALANVKARVVAHGISGLDCPYPSILAWYERDKDKLEMWPPQPYAAGCRAADGVWHKAMGSRFYHAHEKDTRLGCIQPAHVAPAVLASDAPILAEHPQYAYALPKIIFDYEDIKQFKFECGESAMGYVDGEKIVLDKKMYLRSDDSGWTDVDSTIPSEVLIMNRTYGCFIPVCPTKLKFLQQADVSSFVGVSLDPNHPVIAKGTNNRFQCANSSFTAVTLLSDGRLQSLEKPDSSSNVVFIECDTSQRGAGWRVRENYYEPWRDLTTPVGCIKSACTGLRLFDGSEEAFSAPEINYRSNFFYDMRPIYVDGRWRFVCPHERMLHYVESRRGQLILMPNDTTIVCEADGWMMTVNNVSAPIDERTYGCAWANDARLFDGCPPLRLLSSDMLTAYPSISVDAAQKPKSWDREVKQEANFTCGNSAHLAMMLDSKLSIVNGIISCKGRRSSWVMKAERGGRNRRYEKRAAYGCIRPSCSGVSFFDEYEDEWDDQKYNYLHQNEFSVTEDFKMEVVCDEVDVFGYLSSEGAFVADASLKLTCEQDGWTLHNTSSSLSSAFTGSKVGCFSLAEETDAVPETPKITNRINLTEARLNPAVRAKWKTWFANREDSEEE